MLNKYNYNYYSMQRKEFSSRNYLNEIVGFSLKIREKIRNKFYFTQKKFQKKTYLVQKEIRN